MGRLSNVKNFYDKYERHITSGALIAGFIFDNLTLRRPDLLIENIVFFTYLLIIASGITILNLYEGGRVRNKLFERLHHLVPVIIQFSFGNLSSGLLVFYFRSATIAASWFFILILVGLLIGNEVFRKYYQRMIYQISLLFLCIFLISIYYVPVLLGAIGYEMFLLSGFVSVGIIWLFVGLLARLIPKWIRAHRVGIMSGVLAIYAAINVMYFFNLIPPIPLSLKEIGIYHAVSKIPGGYEVKYENQNKNFIDFWSRDVIHIVQGETIYIWSAVFAPTNLSTNVFHRWELYDEAKSKWVTTSRPSYPMKGGREGGYRGYTWKSGIKPGLWRVSVETDRGQVIGRTKFYVEKVNQPVVLEEKIL